MRRYYYSVTDRVWNTWTESELKAWLVNHDMLKSDEQKKRDELVKLVEYVSAPLICGIFYANLLKGPLSVHGRQRLGSVERLGHSRVACCKRLS